MYEPFQRKKHNSVGHNLQHEFDTLTAELDLDLTNNREGFGRAYLTHSEKNNGDFHGLMGGTANQKGLGDLGNFSRSTHSFMDNSLSKVPSNGLGSFLGSGSSMKGPGSSGGGIFAPLTSIPPRPQSLADYSSIGQGHRGSLHAHSENFYLKLLMFKQWMENLKEHDMLASVEYLCQNLPRDTLMTFKIHLDHKFAQESLNSQGFDGQSNQPFVSAPVPSSAQHTSDMVNQFDHLNLHTSLSDSASPNGANQPALFQPKPRFNNGKNHNQMFLDHSHRSRSADVTLNNETGVNANKMNNFVASQQPFEGAKSPTSHLFEKTSFLQQAAATSNSPLSLQLGSFKKPEEPMDLSSHTALKLGALATINSRAALDSNRKSHIHNGYGNYIYPQQASSNIGPTPQTSYQQLPFNYLNSRHNLFGAADVGSEELLNRTSNSSSTQVNQVHRQLPSFKPKGQNQASPAPNSAGSGSTGSSTSSMPPDVSNPELLNNVPAWLKLLRLHKYTECLKDLHWKDLIELDEVELEQRGVKALGARRKLLKAFDAVKRSHSL